MWVGCFVGLCLVGFSVLLFGCVDVLFGSLLYMVLFGFIVLVFNSVIFKLIKIK